MSEDVRVSVEEGLSRIKQDQMTVIVQRARELKIGGKNPNIDSLKKSIIKSDGAVKSEMLYRIGDNLIENGEHEIALSLLEAAGSGMKGTDHEVSLQYSFGLALYLNGRLNEAIEVLSSIPKGKIDKELQPKVNHFLGLSYFDTGDFDNAISSLENARKEYETVKSYESAAQSMEDKGRVYHEQGEYDSALKIFDEAYDFSKKNMLEGELLNISALRGYALSELGRLRPAAEALEFSIGDRTDPYDTIDRMKYLGQIYTSLGSSAKAETAYKELRNLAEMVGDKEEIINALDQLGNHYNSVEKYREAKETLRMSFALRVKYREETGSEFPGSWEFCQLLERVNKLVEYLEADYSDKLGIKPHPAYEIDEKMKQSMKKLIELLDMGIDEPSAYALKYSGKNLKDATNDFQREYIKQILTMYKWEKGPTAKHLGVSTSNLYHYLYKLDIER